MALLKCKMCGGELNITDGQTVCVCEYCGTKQTLPKLDSDRKLNLYDRASYLRRNNDFDKASVIYEQIIGEDKTDAEAYWSLVLCKYGVEYVKDPTTLKRIPTVNRTQFASIFNDPDYKAAIQYAAVDQKILYEEEAKKIDEIQKSILDISKREEPYDIFICYKDTDVYGRRTVDSVLAQDIYNALTKEGYKVFFSRISLEDKIGVAYEPYIFAALNSAKVMIVVGTNKENFDAVWVKNEWSRYLSMIKKGEDKTLVPVYRDMNPYDLPEEFAYLQALDMSKLGFLQDLIHGLNKIIKGKKENQVTASEPIITEKPVEVIREPVHENKKSNKVLIILLGVFIVAALSLGYIYFNNQTKERNYLEGIDLISRNDYRGAASCFEKVKGYKDSDTYLKYIEEYDAIMDEIDALEYSVALDSISSSDMPEQMKEEMLRLVYEKTVSLFDNGDYATASSLFSKLGDYQESGLYTMKCEAGMAQIGSVIDFGSYEQDGNQSNGQEPIEWIVLDKEEDRILAISLYALDCHLGYNSATTSVTWESCSLRRWLNDDFYDDAFSDAEKQLIPFVTVSADANPDYPTYQGNSTQDRVYMLSIREVNRYLGYYTDRQCRPTTYASGMGVYKGNNGCCFWWLRTPGYSSQIAASIKDDGSINSIGNDVANSALGISPVIWISSK